MQKLIQNIFRAGAFLLMLQSAWGFSLYGPVGNADDAWQTAILGYGGNNFDPGAPKDIFEEYRMVVPVQYYASDESFVAYYGASGLTNVDAAFAMLNGVMCGYTNTPIFLYSPTHGVTLAANGMPGGKEVFLSAADSLDRYSPDLSEFPLEAIQINYTAGLLGLWDMKSAILHVVVGELGLEGPDRYAWTLHDRIPDPSVQNPRCPEDEEYLVVQRNFDPLQNFPYSPYINGTLYNFYIAENCGRAANTPYTARTFPRIADTFGSLYSAVAGGGILGFELGSGAFYAGLTRDDAAGFKYLMSSNNINWEATAPSGGTLIATNLGGQQGLITSDLGPLIAASITNDPVTLQGLFPGLVATGLGTNIYFGYLTNVTSYVTNFIGSAYGAPPALVFATNLTPAWITNYVTVFGNVVTNHYYTSTLTKVMTTTTQVTGAAYGSPPVTNTTVQTVVVSNAPSGDYYLIPNGLAGYLTNSTVYTNVVITTNSSLSATNTTTTNSTSISQSILTYSTNYWLLVRPLTLTFPANAPALRRGVGGVRFLRANYDAILGQTFTPLTNTYAMVKIDNNSQQVVEYYQRVVTTPDFVFQAADLTVPNPPNFPYGEEVYNAPTPNFDTSAIKTGLAGPGAIIPGNLTMVFNKTENDLYLNESLALAGLSTNFFLNPGTQGRFPAFGAFDGTTNLPVVYPSTASAISLMNQLIIQVTTTPASSIPGALPDGNKGQPYSITFNVTGGHAPFTWAGGSSVPGLTFNSTAATLSGIPSAIGTFNFPVQVTDSVNRVVNLNYSITIH